MAASRFQNSITPFAVIHSAKRFMPFKSCDNQIVPHIGFKICISGFTPASRFCRDTPPYPKELAAFDSISST